ncbi:MAG: hypothetical protein LUE26_10905 [Alistipes sp.]|nr:hypothetical protein [Alistipes sp.]
MVFKYYDKRPVRLFENFIELYGECLDEIINEKLEIEIYPSHNYLSEWIMDRKGYFATNLLLKGKNIAYNEQNCNAINLSIEERHACIAHEIGHIRAACTTFATSLDKEHNADLTACELGLGRHLAGALRKIIDEGNLAPGTISEMEERIKKIPG